MSPSEPQSSTADRPSTSNVRSFRALSKQRQRFAWLLPFLPALAVVALDLSVRAPQILGFPGRYYASYGAAVAESLALWTSLLWASSAQRGVFRWFASLLFVLMFTLSIGGQLYFHSSYACYLNLDATLFGTSFAESLLGQLEADGPYFLRTVGPAFLLALFFVAASRRLLRPRRRSVRIARFLAPICAVAVFLIPCSYQRLQASTPDVIYFHAIGGLVKELTGVRTTAQIRPGRRSPPTLPTVTAAPSKQRNVILLLTESIRFDSHCSKPVADCPVAPQANQLAAERMPLLQLRSNSSTTAIQLAVLWTGLEPTAGREALHSAPALFDFAHAAGIESAYWTSHHMMFANSRLWVQDLPTRFQCGATDIEPSADIDLGGDDKLLVDRALLELPQLKEPFFAIVHVGNTHVPYKIDPDDAPFVPYSASKAPSDNESYRNYYKNAVRRQDQAIGHFLRELKASEYGKRSVVVFTADHGEAFREHDQVGHTGSLFEEEIHVPGWVVAPEGTLTEEERQNLAAHEEHMAFHTDVTPTMLDLLGLWETPEFAEYRRKMPGASWLRAPRTTGPLLISNCSGVWGCAFRNWGAIHGNKKLIAREWDTAWRSYDVLADPEEKNNLGPDAFPELRDFAERGHGGFPGVTP